MLRPTLAGACACASTAMPAGLMPSQGARARLETRPAADSTSPPIGSAARTISSSACPTASIARRMAACRSAVPGPSTRAAATASGDCVVSAKEGHRLAGVVLVLTSTGHDQLTHRVQVVSELEPCVHPRSVLPAVGEDDRGRVQLAVQRRDQHLRHSLVAGTHRADHDVGPARVLEVEVTIAPRVVTARRAVVGQGRHVLARCLRPSAVTSSIQAAWLPASRWRARWPGRTLTGIHV